jgi:hypothetical protein
VQLLLRFQASYWSRIHVNYMQSDIFKSCSITHAAKTGSKVRARTGVFRNDEEGIISSVKTNRSRTPTFFRIICPISASSAHCYLFYVVTNIPMAAAVMIAAVAHPK